jgi:protein involved in polysaccharide export with SLBB domain
MRSFIVFLLVGCAASVALAQIPTPLPYNPEAPSPTPAAAGSVPAASGSAVTSSGEPGLIGGISGNMGLGYMEDATYKLRVGDAVSFQIREDIVWNALDAPKTLVVTDSGEMDVPYIGRVMVVGKTCGEVAAELKKTLEQDYYQNATVVLSLNQANRLWGRIYILGQVHSPGPMEIQVNENLTVGQAIMRAGGFADFANKNKVKLVRGGADPNVERQAPIEMDMEQILDKGKTENDIKLQPGDFIIVPSRLFNF